MEQYDLNIVLSEIFGSNETNWKPTDKIPLIAKEIEQLKFDLNSYLNTTDYDLPAILEESTQLCKESKKLIQDMQTCKQEIEEETMAEILRSIENRDQLTKDLEQVNFAINIIYDVVQCGKYVKEFENERDAQSYLRAVESVYDLLQYIELPAEGFRELDVYANTKQAAQMIWDNLLHDLYKEWSLLLCWNVKASPHRTIVTMTVGFEDSIPVIDIINALDRCKKLTEKLSEFAQFLLKDIFVPMIHNDSSIHAENINVIIITFQHKQNYKPKYDTVLDNLKYLFRYFNDKLNIEFKRDTTIMHIVAKEINTEFGAILEKDCLIDTIPNNINDLKSYHRTTSKIEGFQNYLVSINFFSEEISLLQYLNNIEVFFSNKSSQYFLETARTIMLKDLSETMSIGVETVPVSMDSTKNMDNEPEAFDILNKTIPKSLFYFPKCMISKSTQELLDHVNIIMEQAVQCTDVVCKKLYITTRLVFELYEAIVPYHHESYLQTIPQYVALFHNNCMYLAHNLQTFGDKWLKRTEDRELQYPVSFVDLVQKLRDLGYKHLTIHMQQQRKHILDSIRSSDLNMIGRMDVLSDNAEAAVRQCLRQLQLLKNVWIGVFPNNVFTRLMVTLVNMFLEELIHRVCSVEDISVKMAVQLTEIYTVVVQKVPHLFQSSKDLEKYVTSWIKLQEIIFILGGTLDDIDSHWNDGKGPLAVHFKVDELRSLIKALFRGSSIRDSLMSKIK